MKTRGFVMVLVLAAVCAAAAQEGISGDIVVIGSDETHMSVQGPLFPLTLDLPLLGPVALPSPPLAPVLPPMGDWPRPLIEQFPPILLRIPGVVLKAL